MTQPHGTGPSRRRPRRHPPHRRVSGPAAALVALALVGSGALATAAPADPGPGSEAAARGDGTTTTRDGRSVPQTSDGVRGPLAAALAPGAREQARVVNESGFRVAPGIRYRRWEETSARGRVRAHLLRANLGRAGVSLDYLGARHVPQRATVRSMVRRADGVAGVNGDFFDINDTGAPIGVGVRSGVTVHGPSQPLGWNISFVLDGKGRPVIKRAPTQTVITAAPRLRVNNVNSPRVIEQGIGLYTKKWGEASGMRVLDGARAADVRQVVVQDGRVVSNSRTIWRDRPIVGRVLLGRGDGATRLRNQLPVGTRTEVLLGTEEPARVAISGNAELLRDGRLVTSDDGEMHPRTAVGIDEDTGRVLLLVVDGRQSFSRGTTMVETARMMRDLGAEDALNLDGGGSSALIGRREGDLRVLNSPSDGDQRPVPNGLVLRYQAP